MKRRNFISRSGLLGTAAALAPIGTLQAHNHAGPVQADLIIKNARIYTMDETRPLAEAVAIRGGPNPGSWKQPGDRALARYPN